MRCYTALAELELVLILTPQVVLPSDRTQHWGGTNSNSRNMLMLNLLFGQKLGMNFFFQGKSPVKLGLREESLRVENNHSFFISFAPTPRTLSPKPAGLEGPCNIDLVTACLP